MWFGMIALPGTARFITRSTSENEVIPCLGKKADGGEAGGGDSASEEWEALGFDPAFQGLPVSAEKPFPVVMFSPGWGVCRVFLLESRSAEWPV
jgi:hypothetical protein